MDKLDIVDDLENELKIRRKNLLEEPIETNTEQELKDKLYELRGMEKLLNIKERYFRKK